MKKANVKVGGHYTARISDKLTTVHIDAQNPRGGWDATNEATGKKVRIKSAQRLRGAVHRPKLASRGGPMALAIPSQAGEAKNAAKPATGDAESKAAKVTAWRKEVAAKTAAPDPELDKAVEAAGKARKAKKAAKPKGERKAGALDAAVQVLKTAGGGPLGCKEMVERMLAKGLWQTKGRTPSATLYAAVIREIAAKGKDSRFRKDGRGQFALAAGKDA